MKEAPSPTLDTRQTDAPSTDTSGDSGRGPTVDTPTSSNKIEFYSFFSILSGGIATPAQIAEYIDKGLPLQFRDEFGRLRIIPGNDPRCTTNAAFVELTKLSRPYFEEWAFLPDDEVMSQEPFQPDDAVLEREAYGVAANYIEQLITMRGDTTDIAGSRATEVPPSDAEGLTPAKGDSRALRSDHSLWLIAAALLKYLLMNNTALRDVQFERLDQSHDHGLGKIISQLKIKTGLTTDDKTISQYLRRAVELYKAKQHPTP